MTLNIDFSAFTGGSAGVSFGDLVLCDFAEGEILHPTCPALTQVQADALNGQTVSQLLAEANTVLGGGTGTYGLTICHLVALAVELNGSFINCTPSAFAQEHLCPAP